MRVVDVVQGTPEWLQVRTGRITGSRMAAVVAKRKRGTEELACRRDYRMELLCERLTGRTADHYVSPEMEWGSEQEQFARAAYEVEAGVMVDQVGFILHPTMDFWGSSPDSVVGCGGLEIKCPKTSTHLEWRMAGVVPEEHQPQMLSNMVCAESPWWDFLSFDPRLPIGLRCFLIRMHRDEKRIAEMEFEAVQLNAEIEEMCARLGMPKWVPSLPKLVHTEEMVSLGDLSIPKDLSDLLDGAEIIP